MDVYANGEASVGEVDVEGEEGPASATKDARLRVVAISSPLYPSPPAQWLFVTPQSDLAHSGESVNVGVRGRGMRRK